MAHLAFIDGVFFWNSVDLSAHVRAGRLRITPTFTEDSNTMGATGRKVIAVLDNYDLEIEFSQDYAASQVDATISPDAIAKTARAWRFRPTSGAISTTNPEYQGTGYAEEYEPIGGTFGEVLGTRLRVVPSVAGVIRDTTP